MIIRLAVLVGLIAALGGCTTLKGTVAGGESRVFEAPRYVVRGLRQYDQDWIDGNIEAGIAAFGWPRPKARPPELDAVKAVPRHVVPKKKPGLIQRIKDRITRAPVTNTVPLPPEPPVVPVSPVVPVPAPVDPVDQLLGKP